MDIVISFKCLFRLRIQGADVSYHRDLTSLDYLTTVGSSS